jgi:uncharacterized protein YukE
MNSLADGASQGVSCTQFEATIAVEASAARVSRGGCAAQSGDAMPQAIANPDELRRFAQMLKKFNTGLEDQMAALAGQLDHLSATWRDQENQKFCEEFHRNLQLMSHFLESNNEYIPFLLRKADRIDEYLQQR